MFVRIFALNYLESYEYTFKEWNRDPNESTEHVRITSENFCCRFYTEIKTKSSI